MLNRDRKEVIDALYESVLLTGNEHQVSTLNAFCNMLKLKFKTRYEIKEWLDSEYVEPFKLTQAEKCILEILQFEYHWIFKDGSEFKACYSIPVGYKDFIKEETACVDLVTLPLFDGCFECIKEDKKTYRISDILENCEVID